MQWTIARACVLGLLSVCSVTGYGTKLNADEQRLQPEWLALDRNQDGLVSLNETHPMQARALSLSDRNRDGNISLSEYVLYDRDPGGAAQIPLADNVHFVANQAYADSDDPRQTLDIYLPKQAATDEAMPVSSQSSINALPHFSRENFMLQIRRLNHRH